MAASYPTAADLEALLTAMGIDTAGMDLSGAAAAGVAAFEGEVGRKMLAEATATLYFDPPCDGLLDLSGDLAAAPEAVTFQPLDGGPRPFVAAYDYQLDPRNALAKGQPVERLLLRTRWWTPYGFGLVGSIAVTGLWGYGTAIPQDAWLAMRAAGAAGIVAQTVMGTTATSGALKSWREGTSSEEYAVLSAEELGKLASQLGVDYPSVVGRYRKVVFG